MMPRHAWASSKAFDYEGRTLPTYCMRCIFYSSIHSTFYSVYILMETPLANLSDLSGCLFGLASLRSKHYPFLAYLFPDLSRWHRQEGRSSGWKIEPTCIGLRVRCQGLAMFIWIYDVWFNGAWFRVYQKCLRLCVCVRVFFQCFGLNLAGRDLRKQLPAVQFIWYHLSGKTEEGFQFTTTDVRSNGRKIPWPLFQDSERQ